MRLPATGGLGPRFLPSFLLNGTGRDGMQSPGSLMLALSADVRAGTANDVITVD